MRPEIDGLRKGKEMGDGWSVAVYAFGLFSIR